MDTCPNCGYAMEAFDTECVRCNNLAKQAAHAPPSPPVAHPSISPSYAPDYRSGLGSRANNSGRDEMPPTEVVAMGFSWGAFGLCWIWGIANKVWISLVSLALGFIPGVGPVANFCFVIWLGRKGHELAWRRRRFESMEQYRTTMAVWNAWGIAGFIMQIILGIIVCLVMLAGEQQ